MLITVATATGRWPLDLLDVPVWQLLYVAHHLGERESRRALHDRAARVDAGYMTMYAFNHPAGLDDERRAVQQALDAHLYERPTSDPAVLQARADGLLVRLRKGRALAPEAIVS